MTHLRIEQNNILENVSSAVIEKLYELATSGDLDASSNLAGNLHTTATYLEYIDALCKTLLNPNGMFPDLTISATDIYIMFTDPEVLRVLLANNIGDGTGVTLTQAASANIGEIFKDNTTITSFNEFDKFTSLNYLFSFRNCSKLENIKIPNSVTYIADNAFDGCTKLASIDFGTGVTGMGKNAFSGDTSITSILLPITCSSMGLLCFAACTNLSSIDLSHILTIGGQGAFYNCTSLTSVDLSSLTTPSYEAFVGCTSLLSVIWSTTANIGYHYFDGCTSLTTVIEPGSSATGTVTLSHLSSLGEGAFKNCSAITTVDLSNSSITNIYAYAFLYCTNLTSVTLPNTCTSLGQDVFSGCTNLSSINFPTSLTSIGENVFRGCSSLGSGQTLELNLTNQTNYPSNALRDTAFTRLILHSPLLSSNYDTRYPIYEDMRQLTYLDLSDWRPGKDSFNTSYYTDCQFYNNTSLVTYIAPITTNHIDMAINNMERYANARYFILLNTTPPSLNTTDQNSPPNEWFYNRNGNVHIYVPDSAVSAYLNDSAWSTIGGYNGSDTISDRLHGLSELPAGVWTTGLASQYLTAALLATS